MAMLDIAGHFQPRDCAFYIIYAFSGQWLRISLFLWIGNLVLLRKKLIGQILGPIFAMMLLSSAGFFVVSAILDHLVLTEDWDGYRP